jgi:hypothetical protein
MLRAISLTILFAGTMSLPAFGQTPSRCDYNGNKNDKRTEEEFKRLHAYEAELIVRGDVTALENFYPEDHIVTNPFNQLIGKKTVLERVRGNIIKYKSYEKKMEYLCVYEHTAIIAGIEIGTAAEDANRPDAGQTSRRRFTETWMKRGKQWRKVARHVSTIAAQ